MAKIIIDKKKKSPPAQGPKTIRDDTKKRNVRIDESEGGKGSPTTNSTGPGKVSDNQES